MDSSKKSSRKRKQREVFSPLSNQEESSLMHALHASLRPIPTNPDISEDEIEDESDIIAKIEEDEKGEESEEESEETSLGEVK